MNAAIKFNIEHRVLDAGQIMDEFPQFILNCNERAYFENEMGLLRPETCVDTHLAMAGRLGSTLRLNERVMRVEDSGSGIHVVTDKATYSARTAIVSAGPWVNDFAAGVPDGLFKVYRQVLYWFDVSDVHENFVPGRFPTFIWEFGRWKDDYFYGFPAINGPHGGLKIAAEDYLSTTPPEEADREVSAHETAAMFDRYVAGHLNGVRETCVGSAVCLYTVTPNSNFVIDRLSEDVILASPCSGHGFKHSAAIGESLAELALTGKSTIDISPFALSKFQ
jgi:sarcosine oxidase